jgi:hypothetical protein
MNRWQPTTVCPGCNRTPNVTFSEREVLRARSERQGAHVAHVICTRCGTGFWLLARDVAEAQPVQNGRLLGLFDPATAAALRKAGLTTAELLRSTMEAGKLEEVPGLGPARVSQIRKLLDAGAESVQRSA